MNNKLKPNLFAAVVLRALLLVLPVSACATAETGQEIGVPQAMQASAKGCFGAVLTPDVDRFYTLREGLLTQYKIHPFKKLDSIAIDQAQLSERQYESWCNVWITNDKSKLIIVYRDRMYLLDARTGQILRKFEKQYWGAQKAILNEDELVILHIRDDTEGLGRTFDLSVWDANTLRLKQEIFDLKKNFGLKPTDGALRGMSKILDRIYLATELSLVVLNSTTYVAELSIAIKPESRVTPSPLLFAMPKLSKNYRKLYVPEASQVTDYLNDKRETYDVRGENILIFDQKSRAVAIEKMGNISREQLNPVLVHTGQLSRNDEYVAVSQIGGARTLLANLTTAMRYSFAQYESGEAILFECPMGRECEYFQLTNNAKKYIIMKNNTGQNLPINNATFSKYNQTKYVQ